jgi:hypothetical protein
MAQLHVSDHSAAPYMFLTDFAQVEFDFEQESLFELQPQLMAMTEEEAARFWRFVQSVVCSIASTIYWAAWSPLRI